MENAKLKAMLKDFFKEMIVMYGTDSEKKSLLDADNRAYVISLWMDILIDEKITPESFLKRWKALKKVYGTSKEHYGIPKPAYFLTIQPAKEERELEPEPPKEIIRDEKWEKARASCLSKIENYSKETETGE